MCPALAYLNDKLAHSFPELRDMRQVRRNQAMRRRIAKIMRSEAR